MAQGQEIMDIPVVQAFNRLNMTRMKRTLLFLLKLVWPRREGQSAVVAGTMAE